VLFVSPIYCSGTTSIPSTFTTTQTGSGTYYGPNTSGNCGYGTLLPSWASKTVAINAAQYAGASLSQGCGLCVSVKGDGTSGNPFPTTATTYLVTDQCPGCSTGDLDFALNGNGKWGISWVAVACPTKGAPWSYKLAGSNEYYVKIQVVGPMVPVFGLSLSGTACTRTADNFFTCSGNWAAGASIPVVVTSCFGENVSDTLKVTSAGLTGMNGVLIASTKQFTKASAAESDATAAQPMDDSTYIAIGVVCAILFVLLVVLIVFAIKRRANRLEIH